MIFIFVKVQCYSSLLCLKELNIFTLFMRPGIREAPSKSKCKIILSRDKRPSKRASVGRFFLQVPWSDLLSPDLSCELKLRTLTDIINLGLNTIMPERSTKVYETDRPWLSVQLKQLIACSQKAFASGNQYLFRISYVKMRF